MISLLSWHKLGTVASEAGECRSCGHTNTPRERLVKLRKIGKTGFLSVIGIIAIIIVSGCQHSPGNTPGTTTTGKAPASNVASPSAPAKPAGIPVYQFGQTVTVNGYNGPAYKITLGVPQESSQPAGGYGDAPQNGAYIAVQISVNAIQTVYSMDVPDVTDFTIIGSDGQRYDYQSGNAIEAPYAPQTLSAASNSLPAGESVFGYLVFDAPAHGTLQFDNTITGAPMDWRY